MLKISKKSKIRILIIISTLLFLLIIFSTQITADDTNTVINIDPQRKNIQPDEEFILDITIIPDQPVKGVEFKIFFDPTMLQAIEVTEGDFFSGYTSVFNQGEIDNINGRITKIYGLILGEGDTTNTGIFSSISFSASQKSGTSTVDLVDVGITDAIDYIPITVNNGIVEIQNTGSSEEPYNNNDAVTQPITNNPPNTPLIPSGPTFGFINTSYSFITKSNDLENDDIYYYFNWDDNTDTQWKGPYKSGETIIFNHLWEKPGTYNIKVKAKDKDDLESSWSQALKIVIIEQSKQQEDQQNQMPSADFEYKPKLPKINEEIEFIDISVDNDGNIIRWLWDFGDNTTSDIQNPTKQYEIRRDFIVTLTVWDNNETINTISKQIQISDKSEEYEIVPEENSPKEFQENIEGLIIPIFIISLFISIILTITILIMKKEKI